jgi:hypothetical protein
LRGKSSVASANSRCVAYLLLCVRGLRIRPHSRSIGFKCGQ